MVLSIGTTSLRANLLIGAVFLGLPFACGGEGGSEVSDGGRSTASSKQAAAPEVEKQAVDPQTVGSVSGVVRVEGEVPDPVEMSVTSEYWCAQHTGGTVTDTSLLVENGKLSNAVVWVVEGLESYLFETPTEPVKMDQKGCMYVPRVVALQVGQPLLVHTSDEVLHNVNVKAQKNRGKNLGMPPRSAPREIVFKKPEVAVPFQCDVHPWMRAAAAVVPHPCFSKTDGEGQFTIEGLPPGDHVLEVWHERLGTKRISVTVSSGEEVTIPDVVYSAP